jgi:hypothetical protein
MTRWNASPAAPPCEVGSIKRDYPGRTAELVMVVTMPSSCRAGRLLGHGEERLALLHDAGSECGAGAGVAYRVDYPGRDGHGLASVVHLGGLAVGASPNSTWA